MQSINQILKSHYTERSQIARVSTFVLAIHENGLQAILGHAEKIAPLLKGIGVRATDLNDDPLDDMLEVIIPGERCAQAIELLTQHGSVAIVDRFHRSPGTFGPSHYLVAVVPKVVPTQNDADDVI
jgi:hypothetical protein